MEHVTRRVRGRIDTFDILTRQEADERGIAHRPWRDCAAGSWGISDDGYVSLCLQAIEYRDRSGHSRRLFTFPYARVWGYKSTKLEWLKRKASGNYHDVSNLSWQEREARTTRTRNAVKLYVTQMLSGKIDYDELGRVYRPDQAVPAATVRRLFKEERIQQMIDQELARILKEKGITKAFVIDKILKAMEVAEAKGDARSILGGADRLGPLVGVKADEAPEPLGDGDVEKYAERALQAEIERRQLTEGDSA